MLTRAQIVWLLFLTSESDSFLFNLFNSAGNGGLSLWGEGRPGGRSRKNNDSDYHTEASSLRHGAADRGMSSHDMSSHNGYSMGMGYGSPSLDHPPRSMQSAVPPAVQQMAPTPTQAAPPAAREEYGSAPSPVATSPQQPIKKAKANYAYMASPDDPNEVSFAKGEILEVLDDAGKWFQVKTSGGIQGVSIEQYRENGVLTSPQIAPSNYLTLL